MIYRCKLKIQSFNVILLHYSNLLLNTDINTLELTVYTLKRLLILLYLFINFIFWLYIFYKMCSDDTTTSTDHNVHAYVHLPTTTTSKSFINCITRVIIIYITVITAPWIYPTNTLKLNKINRIYRIIRYTCTYLITV